MSEHKLILSDEVWEETVVRAAMEETTATAICEHVLQHYVEMGDDIRPPVYIHSGAPNGRLHSVYLDKLTWAELQRRRVIEKRPVSAILEQQLRAYLGMELSTPALEPSKNP